MCERFELGCMNPTTTSFDNSALGISCFRPETHVAQQRRRDKLRAPQSAALTYRLQDFPNQLEELPSEDLIQVRSDRNCDLLYDPTMFSSDMLNFSMNSHVSLAHKDPVLHQESDAGQSSRLEGPGETSFANSSHSVSSNFTPAKLADPQNPCYWKGIGSQQNNDWIVSYGNGSEGNAGSQNPLFGGEILPDNVKESNLSVSSQYLKPGSNGYQDVQSSFTNPVSVISSEDGQKQYGELNFCTPFYQNSLQEVVTSSSLGSQGFQRASPVQQNLRETSQMSWIGGNELLSRHDNTAAWTPRAMECTPQWNDELGFVMNKCGRNLETVAGDSNSRGLSLSLSSHAPDLHLSQLRDRFGSENLISRTGISGSSRGLKTNAAGCLFSKPSIFNKGYDNSVQGIVGSSSYARPNAGPLGPFTGYATILKSSKYLKPAQQLLDEFCSVAGPKLVKTCEMSERGSGDVSVSSDPMNTEIEVGGTSRNSGMSSSSFYSSNEAGGEVGVGSESCQSYHPDFQQKKAKLLYMQDEVCRRYKQYHQQMQTVVSSFESVAGLSTATPYTSLALKSISKHFRSLKNSISDQIRHISKALGEDFPSPITGTSSTNSTMAMSRLNFINQSFRKQKAGMDGLGLLHPEPHIWRPQRGLPERAVAVLRAWLFEHFLHPYPTDTDKHLLATQTGLSRNQVSNWFINARVRVWKPMVEEMHTLETKGDTEMDLNSGKSNTKADTDGSGPMVDRLSNKLFTDAISLRQSECSMVDPGPSAEVGQSSEQWSQKRSRVECQVPAGMDEGLMSFIPFHQSRLETGGNAAVSLTLGLRQSAESAHQQQVHPQLGRHFGGQLVHDFVG